MIAKAGQSAAALSGSTAEPAGQRRTIGAEAVVEGIGLHLGKPCRLTFRPAPAGTGIVFLRTDLAGSAPIPARVELARCSCST